MINGKYKLSIIIPAYNAENYVARCFDSILQSVDVDYYEVLFVDDGSTDNTFELANNFIRDKDATQIRIIRQKNSRQGAARNNGIAHAQGRYVMFVDVDDCINPIGFKKYYVQATENNLDMLRFAFKEYDADGNFVVSHQSQFDENHIYSGQEAILMDYTIGSSCGTLFRRDFLINSGIYFREDMAHEDCEYMLRLLPKVERMMVLPVPLYTYCWNENSTDRSKSAASVLRLKQGDIFVAKSYFETAETFSNNHPINKYYYRKGNSLLTQFLLSLVQEKNSLSLNARMGLLSFANLQGVYPTPTFRTLSWKTTLLLFFLNRPIIEKSLIRLFNRRRDE